MSVKWKTWATVFLILACAGVASAGSIGLQFINDSPARTCTMDPAPSPYNTSTQFYVGRSNFTVTANQPDPTGAAAELLMFAGGIGGSLHGYCIDTYKFIHNGQADVWEVVNLNVDPLGAPTLGTDFVKARQKVADLQGLFARHGLTANPTADEAAAMGAAVWEIVNETSGIYNLSGGTFKVYQASGTWASKASDWLTTLSMPADTPTPILYALVDPTTQDFVIAMAGVKADPVPEPFTMLTASLAIGGLGVYVRRRSGRSGLAG